MPLTDISYMLLYLLSHILLAAALGMLAMRLRFPNIGAVSLFLMGAATTPFFIGCITLLMLCLPVQIPRWVYMLTPAVLATAVILICLRGAVKRFRLPQLPKWALAALAAGISLFPLLSANAFFAFYLSWHFSVMTVTLVCVGCGGLMAVLTLLLQKDIWRAMSLVGKAAVFICHIIQNGIIVFFVCYISVLLKDSRMGAALLMLLIAACCAGILGLLQYQSLRRCCKMERRKALRFAAYWCIGACALLLQRFGVQAAWTYVSQDTGRVACIFTIYMLLFILVCLAVFLTGRMCGGENTADERPHAGFTDCVRRLYRPAAVLFSLVALTTALTRLGALSVAPIAGDDAKEYMSSAYEIADERTFRSINSYNGSEDGSLISVVHHPAWIAYLGQALTFAPDDMLGYPHDFAARMAFQLCNFYMLLAVYAVARAFLPPDFSLLTVALTLCTPGLDKSVFWYCSRDGFRMIPLLLLILAVYGYAGLPKQSKKLYIPGLGCIFLLSAFTMMGHVLNAVPAAAIAAAFLLFCLVRRTFELRFVWMGLTAAFGAVAGCIQILLGYLERGQLLSRFVSFDYRFANTPYFENFKAYQSARLQGTQNYLERIGRLLGRDYGILSIIGLLACVVFLILAIRRMKTKREQGLPVFLSLIGICFAFMLTDVIAWSEYTFTEWALMNPRYLMHTYPVFALMIAGGLYELSRVKRFSFGSSFPLAVVAVLIGYAAFSAAYGGELLIMDYRSANTSMISGVVQAHKDHQDSQGRILLDNDMDNYYFDCEALSLLSEKATAIRRKQTTAALAAALQNAGIDMVVITNTFIPLYWENTVLMDYVTSNACRAVPYGTCTAYYITDAE